MANRERPCTGIRPEDLRCTTDHAAFDLLIHVTEQLGSDTIVHGKLSDGQSVTVRLQGQQPYRVGQRLRVAPDNARTVLFDAVGIKLTFAAQ